MKKNYKKKIGILGGSFDPAHKGHLAISIVAKKKFRINKIIWAVTKKNPFKSKCYFTLKKRIALAITGTSNAVSVAEHVLTSFLYFLYTHLNDKKKEQHYNYK